jgi:hypothetical protein
MDQIGGLKPHLIDRPTKNIFNRFSVKRADAAETIGQCIELTAAIALKVFRSCDLIKVDLKRLMIASLFWPITES